MCVHFPTFDAFFLQISIYSGYFAQHHLDLLEPSMSPVQFLASKFPGKNEQEYRSHLGNFQITGMTGYRFSIKQ
jgi:ATPase subunit of ABC transporter with duplicated ATPase domains